MVARGARWWQEIVAYREVVEDCSMWWKAMEYDESRWN